MAWLARFASFEYLCYNKHMWAMLWIYGRYKYLMLSMRLITSESDVYRRQNLTYKDGPRDEWVNQIIISRHGPATDIPNNISNRGEGVITVCLNAERDCNSFESV